MANAMATVDTTSIQKIATGFLLRAEQVRAVIAKTMIDSPFAASAAMVAGQFAIEEAMTDEDKAFIKKCVDRKKILVEGTSGIVPDAAIHSVVAEAAAKQLLLGAGHYSVWAGGSLYIKEAGYRHLLKIRGDVSEIDISPGLPAWQVLKDKSMWVIPGTASAMVRGIKVTVECTVGINGNPTDIIANIEAKAFRSLAKRLWLKVSSIEMEDGDVDDTVFDQPEPAAIGHDAGKEITQLQRDRIAAEFELDACRKMIADNQAHVDFFERSVQGIDESDSVELLKEVGKLMKEQNAELKLSERVMKELRRLFAIRQDELKEVAS